MAISCWTFSDIVISLWSTDRSSRHYYSYTGDTMATLMEEKLPWWMNPDLLVGRLVHEPCDRKIYIYFRSQGPDDDRYALVVWEEDGPKLLCELWMGKMMEWS